MNFKPDIVCCGTDIRGESTLVLQYITISEYTVLQHCSTSYADNRLQHHNTGNAMAARKFTEKSKKKFD